MYMCAGYVVANMRGSGGGRERARVGIVIILPPQHAFMWAKVVVSARGSGGGRARARAGVRTGIVIITPHQCVCVQGMVVVSMRGSGGGRARVGVIEVCACGLCRGGGHMARAKGRCHHCHIWLMSICVGYGGGQHERWWWQGKGGHHHCHPLSKGRCH